MQKQQLLCHSHHFIGLTGMALFLEMVFPFLLPPQAIGIQGCMERCDVGQQRGLGSCVFVDISQCFPLVSSA